MNKNQRSIYQLISNLTKNKDLQQDLWIAYLSGDIQTSFTKKIHSLTVKKRVDTVLYSELKLLIELDLDRLFNDTITDKQYSIVVLTLLGFSKEEICEYNDIDLLSLYKEIDELITHL